MRLIDADNIPYSRTKDGDVVAYPDAIAEMPTIEADVPINAPIKVLHIRYKEPEYLHNDENWYMGIITAEVIVDEMPTIEAGQKKGECSEEKMPYGVELISRQAAIDAISECGICLRKIYDLPHIVAKFKYRTSKED